MTDTRRKLGGRGWARVVKLVIHTKGDICTLRYAGICTETATTADHIVPRSQGGSDQLDNLRPACRPCNQHRGNGPDPITDRGRWSRNWTGDDKPWGGQ